MTLLSTKQGKSERERKRGRMGDKDEKKMRVRRRGTERGVS